MKKTPANLSVHSRGLAGLLTTFYQTHVLVRNYKRFVTGVTT